MQELQGNERLTELLKQLEAEGAQVKQGGKDSSALTQDSLSQVSTSPQFEAWVSWTKSF